MAKKLMMVVLAALLGLAPAVFAANGCNKAEVQKAVEQAAKLLAQKGGKAAFADLEKFRFCGAEGYVWVSDMNGVMLMHPISKKLVGANQTGLQDAQGKYFYAELIAKARKEGQGWVSYTWLNPATGKIENKCSYVKTTQMDGRKVWCGAGVYGINPSICK